MLRSSVSSVRRSTTRSGRVRSRRREILASLFSASFFLRCGARRLCSLSWSVRSLELPWRWQSCEARRAASVEDARTTAAPRFKRKKAKNAGDDGLLGGYRDQDHCTASGLGLRPGRGDKRHDDSLTTGGCRLHRLKLLSGRSRFS